MVLDPSANKNDYGTLSVGPEDPNMKKQDTIYQRQPLLPQQNSLALTIEDSDDEPDSGRNQSNGRIINIKLPPPLKDEPRFPKEIFKTFLGELSNDDWHVVFILKNNLILRDLSL